MLDPLRPEMSDDELIRWAQGYLAGADRAAALQRQDDDHEQHAARIRAGFRTSERAARSKIWRAMVLAGEHPDPDEIERRLWALTAPT